jgi:hypothetical protein
MPELTLYDDYSREDVHANFAPDTAQELHGLTGKESAAAQVFSRWHRLSRSPRLGDGKCVSGTSRASQHGAIFISKRRQPFIGAANDWARQPDDISVRY